MCRIGTEWAESTRVMPALLLLSTPELSPKHFFFKSFLLTSLLFPIFPCSFWVTLMPKTKNHGTLALLTLLEHTSEIFYLILA